MVVSKVTIVRDRWGSDKVYLHTDLPPGKWPFRENERLEMTLARSTAESYCFSNFPGVEVEVIDVAKRAAESK